MLRHLCAPWLKNRKILHDFVRYFAENSGDWDRSIYCPTAKGHQKEMNKFKRQEEIKKKYEEITIVQNLAIAIYRPQTFFGK